MDEVKVMKNLLLQFGEDVPIKKIAQYAEDEFMIPFWKAARIIYEAIKC